MRSISIEVNQVVFNYVWGHSDNIHRRRSKGVVILNVADVQESILLPVLVVHLAQALGWA